MIITAVLCSMIACVNEPYVDPAIQGSERELMLQVLAPYGNDFTGDAIYIDESGAVHKNKLSIEVLASEQVPGTTRHRWPDGEEFELSTPPGYEVGPPAPPTDIGEGTPPPSDAEVELPSHGPSATVSAWQQISGPPVYAGSGPYRRVFIGPSFIDSADAGGYLSANAGLHPSTIGGTGYVYMSPWSVQSNYSSGGDYGLQFSHTRRVWDPFCVVGGKAYSSRRNIPPLWNFAMNMRKPRTILQNGVVTTLVDFYVRAFSGSNSADCIWIGAVNRNRLWDGLHFGVSKVISIAQGSEGNIGSFHEGTGWTSSLVTSNNIPRPWSQHLGGFSLQRYPTAINLPRWTRMPVITAGTSPDAEPVGINCRP